MNRPYQRPIGARPSAAPRGVARERPRHLTLVKDGEEPAPMFDELALAHFISGAGWVSRLTGLLVQSRADDVDSRRGA